MAKRKAASPSAPRLTIPSLIGGEWDSVIISTYGADLAFFEDDLWRQLERTRNRIIFADDGQVRRYLWLHRDRRLRHLNRSYVLAPLRVERAAHAKLIMLLRHGAGLLAVGSGNLSYDGYASQGECFTTYEWSAEEGGDLAAFVSVREFLDGVVSRKLTDPIVASRLSQAWNDAPFLFEKAPASPICHNLTTPLLTQFLDGIGGEPVDELVVHAPFYDGRCQALGELLKRTQPKRLRLLLQEGVTSVDPKQLARVLRDVDDVDVRTVQAEEKGTFLHAKFIIAKHGSVATCLQGSPNISTPALLWAHPAGNIGSQTFLPVDPTRSTTSWQAFS